MKEYKDQFPELYQYLGGLFHQDWAHVFSWNGGKPDFRAVVRYFKIRNARNYEHQEMEELRRLLSLEMSETDIESLMDKWNVAYYPYGENIKYKEWLLEVLKILEEPMEKTKKEFIPEFIG